GSGILCGHLRAAMAANAAHTEPGIRERLLRLIELLADDVGNVGFRWIARAGMQRHGRATGDLTPTGALLGDETLTDCAVDRIPDLHREAGVAQDVLGLFDRLADHVRKVLQHATREVAVRRG